MNNNLVGDNIFLKNRYWSFSGDVVNKFEKHIKKSIPLYEEGHNMILKISKYFIKDNSICYEIGTSTGILSYKLSSEFIYKKAKFIGIDIESDMINFAKKKYKSINLEFICDNILKFNFKQSDFIISYYTIQFIPDFNKRQILINNIYKSLNHGGAFLYFEKINFMNTKVQNIITGTYNEYKLEQGYSINEIIEKSKSLECVLKPSYSENNINILREAGFTNITVIMKFGLFEGILAIK